MLTARHRKSFWRDGPAADHTLRHHGIGDRACVAADAAVAVFRSAPVRRSDRRADPGRNRDRAGFGRKAIATRTRDRGEQARTDADTTAGFLAARQARRGELAAAITAAITAACSAAAARAAAEAGGPGRP